MRALAAALVLALAGTAAAAPDADGHHASLAVDGSLTAAALAGALLLTRVPVHAQPWHRQLLPIDDRVKDNFSAGSAQLSNLLLGVAVLTPLAAQARGWDHDSSQRALIYGETLGTTLLLGEIAKVVVRRPRPYSYNDDPDVARYTAEHPSDAALSFFSGHAAISFAAAVSGSYLFALSQPDPRARALMWGVELGLASATANLRVRAGRHFYSDVIVGALVGAATGVIIPMAHGTAGRRYVPSAADAGAMAGGVLAGALVSQILPVGRRVPGALHGRTRVALAPLAVKSGGGMMLGGRF